MASSQNQASSNAPDMKLFVCCFIALITTSFGFIVRVFAMGDWAQQFGFSHTQSSEIFGVGLWPFAISIVLFSLIIDKIGYKTALWFAFACHIISVILTLMAKGYWSLYLATFICALGNGTVEAVINPVVATMFSKDKGKWLNALHAGWPGGLALAGVIAIAMTGTLWQTKVFLILIPTIIYGIMMIPLKFPVNERVAKGVPYMDMLKEFGGLGALVVSLMIVSELTRVVINLMVLQGKLDESVAHNFVPMQSAVVWIISLIIGGGFWAYTKSAGRPLFVILLLIMIPLATTELGTDSWVTSLMGPHMKEIGLNAGWVLVYTSVIMTILRFCAGPLIHKLSPLGLLSLCSFLAMMGLVFLSKATGIGILAAATLYGVGKTFFWPTMLSVVSERFPKGGALTLNATGGVGMLSVGVIGMAFLGIIQDRSIDSGLQAHDQMNGTALHSTYVTQEKSGILGKYNAVDQAKIDAAPDQDKAAIAEVMAASGKNFFMKVTVFPLIMLISYVLMLLYFKSQGGYKPVHLDGT